MELDIEDTDVFAYIRRRPYKYSSFPYSWKKLKEMDSYLRVESRKL